MQSIQIQPRFFFSARIFIMARVEQKQVPNIYIGGHNHHVTTLETHLRGLRQSLGVSAAEFASECGLDTQTYSVLENRGIGKGIKPKTLKIIERIGADPQLEDNPHAVAVVTILSLESAKKKIKKFGANRELGRHKTVEATVMNAYIDHLIKDLVEKPTSKIIFNRDHSTLPEIYNGIQSPDIRTEDQKWDDTIQSSSIGTATKYIRLSNALSKKRFSRRINITEAELEAIERNGEPPSIEQRERIIANAHFKYNSLAAQDMRRKTMGLLPNRDGEISTYGIDPDLVENIMQQDTPGHAVMTIRNVNNLSQAQLGAYLPGIASDKSRVYNIERGKIVLEDFVFANLLNKLGFDIHHPLTRLLLQKHYALAA